MSLNIMETLVKFLISHDVSSSGDERVMANGVDFDTACRAFYVDGLLTSITYITENDQTITKTVQQGTYHPTKIKQVVSRVGTGNIIGMW